MLIQGEQDENKTGTQTIGETESIEGWKLGCDLIDRWGKEGESVEVMEKKKTRNVAIC